MSRLIIASSYLPPISFFMKMVKSEKILLESCDYYIKQTYRNRCYILTANGVMPLTVPVVRTHTKTLIKDIKIDYKDNWQLQHFRSIDSAYRSSPFYEYYLDDLKYFFENKETFLFDFNFKLLNKIIELIGFRCCITTTEKYEKIYNFDDYREVSSKTISNQEHFKPYYQVFNNKFGFTPNLSIIDLLFNEGNNTFSFIKQ